MLSITATELPRFMACNGSRLMGDHTPPIERDTTVRDEGVAVHWLVEQVRLNNKDIVEFIDRKAENGVYITCDMVEHLQEYLEETKDAEIEIDTTHSGSTGKWEIRGRADCIKYNNKTLRVSDLKYGWSIVDPEMNWTLISHAIAWRTKNPEKPVETFEFIIYQPRPYHPEGTVRKWSISVAGMKQLISTLLDTLHSPTDDLNTSVHCRNCPSITACPAARAAQMNCIDMTEKLYIEEIDNDQLSFELDQLKRGIEVLKERKKAYDDLAKFKLTKGEIIPNYSIDQDLANRSFKKDIDIEFVKSLTDKEIIKEELISPIQMERRGVPKEVVASLVERRVKGTKLVRMDANTKAKKMFERKTS